jgi:sugar transferase EpsL
MTWKRVFDVIASLCGLIVLSPFLLVIAIIIYIKMGRPILYAHTRAGLHGRPFVLYKFRTMRDIRDQSGRLLPDKQRLSPFGLFLRSSSLDELPELLNVLRGEMSLVGPRPLLMEYLPRYDSDQRRRHDVRPGITGWAQVNGRNTLSWEDRFELDLWYISHWSFWLDLKILAITSVLILRREGVNPQGQATMPEFLGSDTLRRN